MRRIWKVHGLKPGGWTFKISTELTDKRLRRGVFTSGADLSATITGWAEHWNTEHWNTEPKPFIGKAAAGNIIERSPVAGRLSG